MTPALTEALKDFETSSRKAPENKDALRTLKRENYAGYINHLSVMSDKEAAGDTDSGRFYRNRLAFEEYKTDAKERLEDIKDSTFQMGMRALELSGVVVAGVAGKIDDKILAVRMERGARRKKKRSAKQEAWQEKQRVSDEKWLAKKAARRERLQGAIDTVTSPYRKVSRGVMSVYARGLEASDPAKAAELRSKMFAQREKERLTELSGALDTIDFSVQSPTVQRLLETDIFSPEATLRLENKTDGFVSAQFETVDDPDTKFALFYGRQAADDEQLTPLLIEKRKGHAWTFRETPEGETVFGGSKDALYSSVLTGMAKMSEGINPVVSLAEMQLLDKLLSPAGVKKPESVDSSLTIARKYVNSLDTAIKAEENAVRKRALLKERSLAMKQVRSLVDATKRQKATTQRSA